MIREFNGILAGGETEAEKCPRTTDGPERQMVPSMVVPQKQCKQVRFLPFRRKFTVKYANLVEQNQVRVVIICGMVYRPL